MNAMPGLKFDKEKNRLDLLFIPFLKGVARILTFGSKKYAPDNWKKVKHGRRRYYRAAMSHIMDWRDGEEKDLETGEHHLLHAGCCIMFAYGYDVLGIKDDPEPCNDQKCDVCYPGKKEAEPEKRKEKRVRN